MKNLLSILTVGLFFLFGCVDNESIVGPDNKQETSINSNSVGPNWITLPKRIGSSVETEYTVTGLIDGSTGGKLVLNEIYFGGPLDLVKVNASLKFPKGCFQGTQTITMVVDNVNGTVTYSPSMNFDIPALLDLTFQGIDLTGINPDSIDFVYQNPNGYFDSMEYRRLTVNITSGTLILTDGEIPHFSRFGFSR